MKLAGQTIAVIGGSLAGMVCAYELQETIKRDGLPYRVRLFEADNQLGGHFESVAFQGHLFNRIVEKIETDDTQVLDFIQKLVPSAQIIRRNLPRYDVYQYNRFFDAPYPNIVGIPLIARDIFKQGLLSTGARLDAYTRMIFAPKSSGQDRTQNADTYLRNKFGDALIEQMILPHLWDRGIRDLRDYTLEDLHPLIMELGAFSWNRKALLKKLDRGDFGRSQVEFPQGIYQFINALVEEISPLVTYATKINRVSPRGGLIKLSSGKEDAMVRALVVATSPRYYASIFTDEISVSRLQSIKFVSLGTMFLKVKSYQLQLDSDAQAILIPRHSQYFTTKISILNKLYTWLAHEEDWYLRVQFGRPGEERVTNLSDQWLKPIIWEEVKEILKLPGQPIEMNLGNWLSNIPHQPALFQREFECFTKKAQSKIENLVFVDELVEGYDMVNSIKSGRKSAHEILSRLKASDGL